ncbi:hypothetical protein TNCV_4983801 [Trichonephila clavipes]|nr:hypothetical protein TNCV_4983801 [Trichonephila clavipes]
MHDLQRRQSTSSAQYTKYGTEERFAFQCPMMSSDWRSSQKPLTGDTAHRITCVRHRLVPQMEQLVPFNFNTTKILPSKFFFPTPCNSPLQVFSLPKEKKSIHTLMQFWAKGKAETKLTQSSQR